MAPKTIVRSKLLQDSLLFTIDHAFHGRAWQGTTLLGSLRGVTPKVALFRPSPRRKCIWEQMLHAAYWKYSVAAALGESSLDSFPRSPSNWPRHSAPADDRAWRADIALLKEMHGRVRAAVESTDPDRLFELIPGRKVRAIDLIAGIAAHDAYHTGQIQLLKRLART